MNIGPLGLLALTSALGLALPASAQSDPPAGQHLFAQQCAICHAIQPGKNMMGPSLAGVTGRKAGTVEGFHYSDALRNSAIVWNKDTLDSWLKNPPADVPGSHMPFAGIADPEKRAALIAYLGTL